MVGHLHPRPDRVVLVCSGERAKATGYLVDSRHVLTADHAVRGVAEIKVRICGEVGDGAMRVATKVWPGPGDHGPGQSDVALLRLDVEVEGNRGRDPSWASCGYSDLECEAIGYPKFQDEDRDGATRPADVDTERFEGRLEPYAGLEHGRLNAKHAGEARPNEDWKGFSGAALFVDERLVGVVTKAHRPIARMARSATREGRDVRGRCGVEGVGH